MATERLPLDAVLGSTALTGATVANLDDDPNSPDANWATLSGTAGDATEVYASFGSPSGSLSGTNEQTFEALVRQNAAGGAAPTARIELWEGGSLIRAGSDGALTNGTGGEVITLSWDESEITNAADVEIKVIGTGSAGMPADRRSVEVGAVSWDVTYTVVFSATGSQTFGALTQAGSLAEAFAVSGSQTLGALAQAASLEETFTPAGAQTVGAATQTATLGGAQTFTASGAQTLGGATQAASPAETFTASGAQTFGGATQTSSLGETFTVTAAQTVGAATQTGYPRWHTADGVRITENPLGAEDTRVTEAGDTRITENYVIIEAAGSTLASVTQAASLSNVFSLSVTSAQALSPATQAATLLETFDVAGAQTIAALTQNSSLVETFTVTAAQSLAAATQAASLAETFTITASQALGAATQSSSLVLVFDATGTQTLGAATQTASLAEEFIASGGQVLAAVTQDGQLVELFRITSAQDLAAATQSSTLANFTTFVVTGSQTLAAVTQSSALTAAGQASGPPLHQGLLRNIGRVGQR